MAERTPICGNCGRVNAAGDNYCARCGAFLGAPARDDGAAWRPADAAGDPRLRRQSALIIAIALAFIVACLVLAAVVVIWRP